MTFLWHVGLRRSALPTRQSSRIRERRDRMTYLCHISLRRSALPTMIPVILGYHEGFGRFDSARLQKETSCYTSSIFVQLTRRHSRTTTISSTPYIRDMRPIRRTWLSACGLYLRDRVMIEMKLVSKCQPYNVHTRR
jgi:hypothetical protein